MTVHIQSLPQSRGVNWRSVASGLVLLGMVATLAGAWGFELIGHYQPCMLCLRERLPYYIGIPIAAVAFLLSFSPRNDRIVRILLVIVAALFVWSVYQGVFHIGIEYRWWNPLLDCATPAGTLPPRTGGGLLDALQTVHPPSCSDATWRFPANWGLSFAGWNSVISTGIVLTALFGAFARRRSA